MVFVDQNMSTEYTSTRFQVGIVKTYKDDKGFGFISSVKPDLIEDLFFHIKKTKSDVKEEDRVLFIRTQSKKHADKYEAVDVVKIFDVIDLKKLVQLYLRYGYIELINQIELISTPDQLQGQDVKGILSTILENELLKESDEHTDKALRFTRVLKKVEIDNGFKAKCFFHLLKNHQNNSSQIYLSGYKYWGQEEQVKHLQLDAIQIFNSLPRNLREHYFPRLTFEDRIKLKGVVEIASKEDIVKVLTVLEGENEDSKANYRSIKGTIKIASHLEPFLWLKGLVNEVPVDALKHNLELYTDVDLKEILAKLTVDQKIQVFPKRLIHDQKTFDLYRTFLKACSNVQSAHSAFEIGGVVLSDSLYYKGLVEKIIPISSVAIARMQAFLSEASISEHRHLIKALGWRDSLKIFDRQVEQTQTKALLSILKNAGDYDPENFKELLKAVELSTDSLFNLWYNGYHTIKSPKLVSYYFLIAQSDEIARSILAKFGDNNTLLEHACNHLTNPESQFETQSILKFLKFCRGEDDSLRFETYLSSIFAIAKDPLKLVLWIEDFSSYFDFDKFKIYFATLSSEEQKLFLKKIFFEIKQGRANIPLSEILQLKNVVIDPELARSIEFKNEKVDFTVYVILQAIQDLSNGNITKPERMYEIIANQINTPTELLVLKGFFDKCLGRKTIDNTVKPEEGAFYEIKEQRSSIPRFVTYCEGRKVIDGPSKTPAICEKTGMAFWWCQNSKCYEGCVTTHNSWKEYTLLDFLEILRIPYSQSDYEMFLAYVNKVNKFLEHMNCRKCKHILKPHAKDENPIYGFYRVSNFSCANKECKEHQNLVYLTHCINGHCGGVVDSRDSVRCKPAEFTNGNCGWYICNDCYACCNDGGIGRRIYIIEKSGQQYNCHREGHRERGIICCPKCGTEMNGSGFQEEDYNKVLNWFIANRTKADFIINSGQRRDGKFWFLLRAPLYDRVRYETFMKKLYRYMSIGFNIPDITVEKETYLLGEAFGAQDSDTVRLLICPSCDHKIDLREDFEKFMSMQKYHTALKFTFRT